MKGLQEAIAETNGMYDAGKCVAYGILNSNGECVFPHYHACYGSICDSLCKDIVAIVSQIQTKYHGYFKSLPEGAAHKFINWIVNESVYKDVFLEHDVDKILKENVWVAGVALPGNVVVSAMTAIRALTESNRGCYSAKHFVPLTDAGISPEFAFILGHYLNGGMTHISSGYDSHHCAISKDGIRTGAVANFCNKKFVKVSKGPFNIERTYAGVHTLFGDSGSYFYQWLLEQYKGLPSARQVLAKSDPFGDRDTEYTRCKGDVVADMVTIYNRFKEQFLTEPEDVVHE